MPTIAQHRENVEAKLAELATQAGWATWLQLRRHLHAYSWRNQVLIALQAAEQGFTPSIVQAAWKWKRAGYHPAKGTKALWIWARANRQRADGRWTCCDANWRGERCESCGKRRSYFVLKP